MSTTHTPGPWYTKDGQIIEESTGKTLALIPYFDKDNEKEQANARLIAAAPELLETLILIAKRSRTLLHRDAQGEIEDFETEVKNLLGAIIETAEANAGKAHG